MSTKIFLITLQEAWDLIKQHTDNTEEHLAEDIYALGDAHTHLRITDEYPGSPVPETVDGYRIPDSFLSLEMYDGSADPTHLKVRFFPIGINTVPKIREFKSTHHESPLTKLVTRFSWMGHSCSVTILYRGSDSDPAKRFVNPESYAYLTVEEMPSCEFVPPEHLAQREYEGPEWKDSHILYEGLSSFSKKAEAFLGRLTLKQKKVKPLQVELSEMETLRALKFREEDHSSCKAGFSYIFTPTAGIGISVEIQCNSCKEKKDITDFGTW